MEFKVLIVDDEKVNRNLLVGLINRIKTNPIIDTAIDGAEAKLKIAEEEPPFDLIITDVMMPGDVDGCGVLGEAKARYKYTKVIVISGVPDKLDLAINLGADLTLAKPFGLELLKKYILKQFPN